MDPNGIDHDDGMHTFNVEKSTVIRKRGVYVGGAPASAFVQLHKEKDMFHIMVVTLSAAINQQLHCQDSALSLPQCHCTWRLSAFCGP